MILTADMVREWAEGVGYVEPGTPWSHDRIQSMAARFIAEHPGTMFEVTRLGEFTPPKELADV